MTEQVYKGHTEPGKEADMKGPKELIFEVRQVRGLPFPLDMLRYERATFADEGGARRAQATIADGVRDEVPIKLRATFERGQGPNAARWESYGWRPGIPYNDPTLLT